MKPVILAAALFTLLQVNAQDLKNFHAYNPAENADSAIKAAVTKARTENKHVLIQAGGNWCIWCARFMDFIKKNDRIDSLVQASYITYHLNYSEENKNEKVLAAYGFPQRFGFPVFLILDKNGNRIHTQNSSYLEEGKGYNAKLVFNFLKSWTPEAIDPANYKE